jgi:hypothetical protein
LTGLFLFGPFSRRVLGDTCITCMAKMPSKNKKFTTSIWFNLLQFGSTPAQLGAGIWIGRHLRFFGVFLGGKASGN